MKRTMAAWLLASAVSAGAVAQDGGPGTPSPEPPSPGAPAASGRSGVPVTEVDVLERLEELDRKMDELAAGVALRSTERLRIGIGAIGARYSPTEALDDYVSSFGAYDAFPTLSPPFAGGADAFVEYMVSPRIGVRVRYAGYEEASLGFASFRQGAMAASATSADQDVDGLNDYYSYPRFFSQSLNASIQLHLPAVGGALSADAGIGAGLGGRRLAFGSEASSFWSDLLGSAEADGAWENSFARLGANLGASLRLGGLIIQLSAGADWNLPLSPWSPAYGITGAAPVPSSAINGLDVWVGLFPAIVL